MRFAIEIILTNIHRNEIEEIYLIGCFFFIDLVLEIPWHQKVNLAKSISHLALPEPAHLTP